jgi:hypothetical protein
MHAKLPGVKIIGATVTTAPNSSNAVSGSLEQDAKRKTLNAFIRTLGQALIGSAAIAKHRPC